MLTNWFAGVNQGESPSNTNVGFLQIGDEDAGSVLSQAGSWNSALTTFSFAANGAATVVGCDLINPQDCGRLWNGQGSANGGSFVTWDLTLTATFLSTASFNGTSGLWESSGRPTSLTGAFSGIFHDVDTDGYYRFTAELGQESWAFDGGFAPADEVMYGASAIVDPTATVPEPATMTLLATGLAGLVAAKRRKRANAH